VVGQSRRHDFPNVLGMKSVVRISLLTLLFFVCIVGLMSAQECSTHQRQASKPWTWLKSNMCPTEYDAWLTANPPKPFYKSKQFWVGVAVIGASVAADSASTSHGQHYPGIVETNPLLGPHPSDAKIAGLGAGGFATYFGLHLASYQLSRKDPSKEWRFIGRWGVPASAASVHVPLAVHNYELR
jgi:hypothetical protein